LFIRFYGVLNNLHLCKEGEVVALHVIGGEALSLARNISKRIKIRL
jgi:hypothetical protein